MTTVTIAVLIATPVLALADPAPGYGNRGGTSGGLPVTGFPLAMFIAVGVALLTVGFTLAVVSRRRTERSSSRS